MLISIVIPVFNEAACLDALIDQLFKTCRAIEHQFECIFINDGSTDNSLDIIKKYSLQHKEIKYISFSRNFGHEAATTAGLDNAEGDAVIIIDADLQDSPELIPELIKKWHQGNQIVYAQRKSRKGEPRLTKLTSWFFYRVLKLVSRVDIPVDTGDFRLMDKCVVAELRKCREQNRFIRGLIAWTGFRQASVLYERDQRCGGKTKYNFWKRMILAGDAILGFSTVPLRIVLFLGILICAFALCMFAVIVLQKLIYEIPIKGYALLVSSFFFLSGVQLFVAGIIGEYVGRIYIQTQKRPLYIIDEISSSLPNQQSKTHKD
jgi:dolichol-phosphate mannosyltransferase